MVSIKKVTGWALVALLLLAMPVCAEELKEARLDLPAWGSSEQKIIEIEGEEPEESSLNYARHIKGIEVAVGYYFDGHRLSSVHFIPLTFQESGGFRREFYSLAALLTEKYDEPRRREQAGKEILQWELDDTVIELTLKRSWMLVYTKKTEESQ